MLRKYLYTNATLQQLGLELSTCYGLWLRIPENDLIYWPPIVSNFYHCWKAWNTTKNNNKNKQSINQSNKQIKQKRVWVTYAIKLNLKASCNLNVNICQTAMLDRFLSILLLIFFSPRDNDRITFMSEEFCLMKTFL